MYVRMATNNGSTSKKMEMRKKTMDIGRLKREATQTKKFKKRDVLGKGRALAIAKYNRVEFRGRN